MWLHPVAGHVLTCARGYAWSDLLHRVLVVVVVAVMGRQPCCSPAVCVHRPQRGGCAVGVYPWLRPWTAARACVVAQVVTSRPCLNYAAAWQTVATALCVCRGTCRGGGGGGGGVSGVRCHRRVEHGGRKYSASPRYRTWEGWCRRCPAVVWRKRPCAGHGALLSRGSFPTPVSPCARWLYVCVCVCVCVFPYGVCSMAALPFMWWLWAAV